MAGTDTGHNRARTKIVATLGPASQSPEVIADLLDCGVDVFRINMAHGSRQEHDATIDTIRQLAAQQNRPVGILVDLAGPKIRLGELHQSPLPVRQGDEFQLVDQAPTPQAGVLTSNYPALVDEVRPGDLLLLGDGQISMQVLEKSGRSARLQVRQGGELRSRQGLNLPGVRLSIPTLTGKDRDNAVWAAGRGVDFVSLSFVRSAAEIRELKHLLADHNSPALVIAKIEKREALEQLDEIVAATDGVMVARGDLGVEIDVARTPVVQKQIIDACRRLWRPVIVATEMLDSMQRQPRPTRAEASDVANAILDGADACMLSGETAIGRFPRESVQTMNRIMLATEEMLRSEPGDSRPSTNADVHPVTSAVVHGATAIANQLRAPLLVIASRSGATARVKAKLRSFVPTVGVSNNPVVLRQMSLYWGIIPVPDAPVDDPPRLRTFIDHWGRQDGLIQTGDLVVFVTGTGLVTGAHNLVVVHDVQ